MRDPRIVCKVKFVRQPKHTVPATDIILDVIGEFAPRISFPDIDELILFNVTTFDVSDEETRTSFIDTVNSRANGMFILGSWRQKIEDLEDEPEEEETDE